MTGCIKHKQVSIAKRIKEYRQKFEMTQDMLAKKLKISRNTVTRWESDNVKCNKYTIYFLKMEGII